MGRHPRPTGAEHEQVVPIDDPGRSLSRTHLKFGIDQSGVWIEDCYSANGTAVIGTSGQRIEVQRGQRVRVQVGNRINIGERSFTVTSENHGA